MTKHSSIATLLLLNLFPSYIVRVHYDYANVKRLQVHGKLLKKKLLKLILLLSKMFQMNFTK